MTPQNVEKAAAHALGRDDVLARAQLPDLGAQTLAMLVQLVSPMTSAMLHALGVPMIACKR